MSQETQMIPYRRNMQDLLCDSGQFHLLFLIFTPSQTHTPNNINLLFLPTFIHKLFVIFCKLQQ
jgi:hypothetical protein